MLLLDDPRWNQLKSTYGAGTTVAQLLSAASAGAPLDDWYDTLIQELLHQYTLGQVAFAAVPHLVSIARRWPDTRKHLMVLVGACYAHSGDAGGPAVPSYLQQEWRSARTAALPIILEVLEDPQLDEGDIRYLLSSLAALKGQNGLSIAIEALDTEMECPQCGSGITFLGSQVGGSIV